jgi:excinuclease ABC subunit A
MRALRKLLAAGHSLIVIEHNLDVIRAADWIIDLGPEGGETGGEIVCVGTPEEITKHTTSHTGRGAARLRADMAARAMAVEEGRAAAVHRARARARPDEAIKIVNAREHNLKGAETSTSRAASST